jgi:hypothetical protein
MELRNRVMGLQSDVPYHLRTSSVIMDRKLYGRYFSGPRSQSRQEGL